MAETNADLALARQFEKKATEDAIFLSSIVTNRYASDAQIGNVAQQSVEKTLKAVLARRGVNYAITHQFKTHRIADLVSLLNATGIIVPAEVQEADVLTPFAEGLRYEDDIRDAQQLDRNHVTHLVAETREFAHREMGSIFFTFIPALDTQAGIHRCQWAGCGEKLTDALSITTGYGSCHRRQAFGGKSIYVPKSSPPE